MDLLLQFHAFRRFGVFALLHFCFASNAFAQKITLSVDKYPLEKVFTLIEKQSGYSFIYSTEGMDRARPVTINVKEASLGYVLFACFRDQPLEYTTNEKYIIVRSKAETTKPPSSSHSLRGKVVNEAGEAVQGVTVQIKNTRLVRITDQNGEFGFDDASPGQILIISGAEMDPIEWPAGTQEYVVIPVKKKIGTLDEAIVIAYGKTNKRVSTGTYNKVSKEEINKQPISNPLSILPGRVSGLQLTPLSGAPGTHMLIVIRGRSSIASGTDPLLIVDGVPFPTATLNNTSAGTRTSPFDNLNPLDIESIEVLKDADATAIYGSRGANGVILITTKKGKPGKTLLTVRTYGGAGKVTRKMDLLTTADYLTMRREAFRNDAVNPTNTNAPDLLVWDTTRFTDWQKELIGHTSRIGDINITLSGGTAHTQFLLSTGYHKEGTIYPGSFGSQKMNGNITLNHQSQDRKFAVSFTSSYLVNKNVLPREDLSQRITLAPNSPSVYNADGSLNWAQSSWVNPFALLRQTFTNRTQNLAANINLSYKLPMQFLISLHAGYSNLYLKEHGITPRSSLDPAKASVSAAVFGSSSLQTLIAEPQLSHIFQVHKHRVESVIGFTILQTGKDGIQQAGSGYASDDLLGSIRAATTVTTSTETNTRYRYTGLFGRLAYSFDKKYLATITLRRDGSSRFGPSNRYSNFGSIGLGWVFTQESWLKDQRIISFGKIKGSLGKTGNDQIGDYRYLDLYSPYHYTYQSSVPFYPVQLLNPGFGWEEVRKAELSAELGFFKDRLLITANYYYNETGNQLINYPLAATTGYTTILKNLPAVIRNKGLELEINGTLISRKKFKWAGSFNITMPRNKLARFDDLAKSSFAQVFVVGKPLSIIKGYTFTGVDASTGINSFKDHNGDGMLLSADDEKAMFDASQRFYGGLQQNIEAGRWSLSVLFQFVRQPFASNYISRFSKPGSLSNQPTWVMDRWIKPGDDAPFQRFTVTNSGANLGYIYIQRSDQAFSDASFIRLRNLYCSLDLSSMKLEKAGFQKLLVFVQGQNLVTITNYKGLDPETQTFLPPVKMIAAGIQANF